MKRTDDFICFFPRGSYTPTRWALFSILPFIYCDKFLGGDVRLVDPLIVSRRIALPSHEILQLPSSAEVAIPGDPFGFPLFLPFHSFGRQFKEVGSMFIGLLVWHKEGCMKHIMDS